MNIRHIAYAAWLSVGVVGATSAGVDDRYRYVVEEGNDKPVCRRMEQVYNKNFAYPWKRPYLDLEGINYGPNSPYAFPKLPGVNHDNRMTLAMSFSRQPTSPEFEAIEWKVGRYRFVELSGIDHGYQAMLVAEFDIDNDGRPDTVIKQSFMLTFLPAHRSVAGGEDTLFVFEKGEIDLTQPIKSEIFYRGPTGRKKPAMIGPLPGTAYRLIRPFIFQGAAYLAAYRQEWPYDTALDDFDIRKLRESMHVLRYQGGGENLGPGKWSPLQLDRICRFRMLVTKTPRGSKQ